MLIILFLEFIHLLQSTSNLANDYDNLLMILKEMQDLLNQHSITLGGFDIRESQSVSII